MGKLPKARRTIIVVTLSVAAAISAGCGLIGIGNPTIPLASLSAQDQAFALTSAGTGLYELAVSQLALERAIDPRVKAYAQMLVEHHAQTNRELAKLMAQRGLSPPPSIPADKQARIRQLSGIGGAAFDRLYLRAVGMDDHTLDIALFDRQSRDGKDPGLRDWATRTLPMLRDHLQAAESLHANLR